MGNVVATMKSGAVLLVFVLVGVNADGRRGHGHRNGREDAPSEGYLQPAPAEYAANGGDQAVYGGDLADAASEGGSDLDMLQGSIPGVPGEDYPIYSEVPESGFSCDGQVDGGYYADPEAECQAFHICTADGAGGLAKYSFLCPNGTLFNQNYFICDWWFNFDCATAEDLYSLNDEIAAEREALAGLASDSGLGSYGAPAEYGAASAAAPTDYAAGSGDGAPLYEGGAGAGRRGRRLGNRRNNRRPVSQGRRPGGSRRG